MGLFQQPASPQVDPTTFLRSVERGQVPPVALVHGADVQLTDDVLAAVSRALFPDPAHAAFDREVLDAREVSAEGVVSAALTLPFSAAARLVVVRHCQALAAKGGEALGQYIAGPNPTTVLLLLADESLRASRDRKSDHWLLGVVPASAATGVVVEPMARRGRALEEWLRERAQFDGLTVTGGAARLLVQWVGDDPALLYGEVRKAALAGGPDNRSVGEAEVRAVVGEHRVSAVFDLTRALERRDLGLALRTLDALLTTEEPMLLIAMLTREVRTAWTVQLWRRAGQSVDQIARILRRPPAAVDALLGSLAAESPAALGHKLRRCWEVERALKSSGEPRAELAVLVSELCAAR
jgi:DNA polymerase III delta subunit